VASPMIEKELAALRSVPVPSTDIEQRIRGYVEAMARPQISGIGKGEELKVVWPGAGYGVRGPVLDRADPLALMAILFPDAMTNALVNEVERMAGNPKERAARVVALGQELSDLAYLEEALIANDEDAQQRSPSAPPQAILGVKVIEIHASRAA